jgi:hypothetical protein
VKNAHLRSYRAVTVDLGTALKDLRVAAEINVSEDGGPVRTIINGRHRKPVGRYASRKAGRSLPWEARDERAYFWLCEADANVVSYLCQPHQLVIFRDDGDPLVFYPDVRRDLVGGNSLARSTRASAGVSGSSPASRCSAAIASGTRRQSSETGSSTSMPGRA